MDSSMSTSEPNSLSNNNGFDRREIARNVFEVASIGDADEKHLVKVRGDLSLVELSRHVFSLLFRDYISSSMQDFNNGETQQTRLYDVLSQLLYEANRVADENAIHILQIRSVPVPDFGYLLRHYFVRIDEIVDVHPGNEQRICLRGWYRATDVGSDRLETEYALCSSCLDQALKKLWRTTKGFSFLFKNCDHSCNRSKQSMFIATMLFVVSSASAALLVDGAVIFFICIILILSFAFVVIYVSQTVTSVSLISFLGYNPSTTSGQIRLFRCKHTNTVDKL